MLVLDWTIEGEGIQAWCPAVAFERGAVGQFVTALDGDFDQNPVLISRSRGEVVLAAARIPGRDDVCVFKITVSRKKTLAGAFATDMASVTVLVPDATRMRVATEFATLA